MTNFDTMLAERISEVAEFSPAEAEALEFGATTVVGILSVTAAEVRERFDGDTYDAIVEALFDATSDRIDLLRVATLEAQVAEVEVEDEDTEEEVEVEDEYVSPTKAIDDVLESIFAGLIGAEAAAQVRAEVEADDRAKAEAGESDEDDDLSAEFNEFMASLFGTRV